MQPGLSRGGPSAAPVAAGPALPADAATPPAAGCGGHWTGNPAARSGTVTPAVGSAVWRARGGDGDDRTMGGLALQFATCEVGRAISFINKSYKSSAELKPEDVPLLCDLLRRDILRVLDPTFHGVAAIVLG